MVFRRFGVVCAVVVAVVVALLVEAAVGFGLVVVDVESSSSHLES
jgi:hypothetical protein